MSVRHYRPTGQLVFCRQEGHGRKWSEMTGEERLRECREATTDLRRVTCSLCLWEMAKSMIRKGVGIQLLNASSPYAAYLGKKGVE